MEYYIYMTTNLINGKKYIGQHKGRPNDSYLGSGTTITKAIKKYGKENFQKEILCFCATREEADQKEKEFISLYDAVNNKNFYNNAEGGTAADGWRACHRYYKQHPEKAKAIWQESGRRLQQWRKNNPDDYTQKVIMPLIQASKQWRENNPEKVAIHMKLLNQKKIEWQQAHPEEHKKQIDKWRRKGSETNSQKIICLTTGEIFHSQCEAARHYNIPQTNISKCLKGERHSAGKHPDTGEKLTWARME